MSGVKGRTGIYKRTQEILDKLPRGNKHPKWIGGRTVKENTLQYKTYHKLKFYEWCKKNPEKWKIHKNNVRVKRMGAEGSFTKEEWDKKKKEYNNCCVNCGISEEIEKLTIDHIIPLSKGGTNWIENIQPLCFLCNLKKGNRL